MQRITGDTFPVKEQLKKLGGKWNAVAKCWEVPDDKADAAWALVGGKPQPKAAPKPAAPVVALAKAEAPKPAKPTTPEEAARAWAGGEIVPLGTLRGWTLFAVWKYGCRVCAVDEKIVVDQLTVGEFERWFDYSAAPVRNRWLVRFSPANTYSRGEKLTEEEEAALETPIREATLALKAAYDAQQAATRNFVGEFRGRPLFTAEYGLLYWLGAERDWVVVLADSSRAPSPDAPIELRSGDRLERIEGAEAEFLRPFLRAKAEAVLAAQQAERQAELDRRAAWIAECKAKDRWPIEQGSGYGGQPYTVGQTLRFGTEKVAEGWPEYGTAVKASQRYYREDGLSFGVGDESGYIYSAVFRTATKDEERPVRERIEARARAKTAAAELRALAEQVRKDGERPEGSNDADKDGERVNIGEGQTIYGGGEWFVVGPEWIWHVRNNGHDGDDWSYNNVRTGGAGAIGWRTRSTPELADLIRTLAASAAKKPE